METIICSLHSHFCVQDDFGRQAKCSENRKQGVRLATCRVTGCNSVMGFSLPINRGEGGGYILQILFVWKRLQAGYSPLIELSNNSCHGSWSPLNLWFESLSTLLDYNKQRSLSVTYLCFSCCSSEEQVLQAKTSGAQIWDLFSAAHHHQHLFSTNAAFNNTISKSDPRRKI